MRARFEKYKEQNMSGDEWKLDKQKRRKNMSQQVLKDAGLLDISDDFGNTDGNIIEGEIIEGEG